ncbi:MAG TPA: vitamin B12 dependent-methionine synthase activation domain-containing protein [Anaerolineaceae bacterium]|jgi:5-methyltetrahydrofolate--homocysteine methyltransferase|nr:vitamin B12 dependent-methionine synthase activation domain-containing protein [Anaerolineaceae bacterium]
MNSADPTPVLGAHIIPHIAVEELLPFLNRKALYRISWGAQKAQGAQWEKIQKEYEGKLESMLSELRTNAWITPAAGYGHWMANSEGDTILLYDPQNSEKIIARFPLPRQQSGERLCLADYLPACSSGISTILSLQVVSMGHKASETANRFFSNGNYAEGYFRHGLAVQFAEAAAEYVHALIRKELSLEKRQGRRYSWGYEPIPDLSQHRILFELIPAQAELDMDLTSACQLIPEQSTAAMVIHHKAARYFRIL